MEGITSTGSEQELACSIPICITEALDVLQPAHVAHLTKLPLKSLRVPRYLPIPLSKPFPKQLRPTVDSLAAKFVKHKSFLYNTVLLC